MTFSEEDEILNAILEGVVNDHPEIIGPALVKLMKDDTVDLTEDDLLESATKLHDNLNAAEANAIKMAEELGCDPEEIENPPGYKVMHEVRITRMRVDAIMRILLTDDEEK